MSTDFPPAPSLEARVQALEQLTLSLNARIAQLSQDMTMSFRQAVAYQEQRFNQLETSIGRLASKDDLDSMKNEILTAFNQLLVIINSRSPGQGQE